MTVKTKGCVYHAAAGGKPGELEIFDEIGGWGVTASEVNGLLKDTEGDLVVRCSSPGGDALEGIAIMNLLRAHNGRVTGIVEGIAASAASVIMVGGCDELVLRPTAELMIHEAWTLADGDSQELSRLAESLDHLSNTIASVYAAKAGGVTESWRELMRKETWFNAEEAILAGLADRVEDGRLTVPVAAKMMAKFKYHGRSGAPKPQLGAHMTTQHDNEQATVDKNLPVEAAGEVPAPEEQSTADATTLEQEEEVVKVDAGSDDKSSEAEQKHTPQPQPEPEPKAVDAVSANDLVVTIDAAALEELRKQAAYGEQARLRDEQLARERVVDTAIEENRISASGREKWLAAMEADPEGTKNQLARIPKNLIPRVEIGHNQHNDDKPARNYSGFTGFAV